MDTGPNSGETDCNHRFEFTCTGSPVSCSALTDSFGDAIEDGIHWIAPGSPMDEGLFYVTVEHTGILVLDEGGMFVDNFLWTEHGLI